MALHGRFIPRVRVKLSVYLFFFSSCIIVMSCPVVLFPIIFLLVQTAPPFLSSCASTLRLWRGWFSSHRPHVRRHGCSRYLSLRLINSQMNVPITSDMWVCRNTQKTAQLSIIYFCTRCDVAFFFHQVQERPSVFSAYVRPFRRTFL